MSNKFWRAEHSIFVIACSVASSVDNFAGSCTTILLTKRSRLSSQHKSEAEESLELQTTRHITNRTDITLHRSNIEHGPPSGVNISGAD